MLIPVLWWLVGINALTVYSFWSDKCRAVAGRRRIREADLLGLALIGGSPGASAARRMFRHKTRKEPFSTYLMVIMTAQAGIAGSFLIY